MNLEHVIEDDGYEYRATPLQPGHDGQSHGVLSFYAHFARAFEQAQLSWQAKIEAGEVKYADSFHLYSMVLGMDGMPVALVANVDDIVQVFPFSNGEKVEVDQ